MSFFCPLNIKFIKICLYAFRMNYMYSQCFLNAFGIHFQDVYGYVYNKYFCIPKHGIKIRYPKRI